MKKRLFGLFLCVALLISSMSVMAAETSKTFGRYGVAARAKLETFSNYATATTTPSTSYSSVRAQVRFLDDTGPSDWSEGSTSATRYSVGLINPYQVESYHYIDTYSTYLSLAF